MSVCGTLQLQSISVSQSLSSNNPEALPQEEVFLPNWYAVFTLSKHEKRVFERCEERQIESFLPLYNVTRKWKNRCTVNLELPLFPNYFFVRIIPRDRIRVLDLSGVVSIISSAGKLLPVQEEYMTALRDGLLVHKMEPHPDIEVGERVRINSGPLTGAQGILERRKNELRVVLRLEMLARSVSVEVAATQIELCAPRDHDVRNSWSTKRSSLPPGTELADPDSTSVWGTTLRPIRNSEAAF